MRSPMILSSSPASITLDIPRDGFRTAAGVLRYPSIVAQSAFVLPSLRFGTRDHRKEMHSHHGQ
eukprot:255465-Pyramimonas_sp.AAC.1